MYLGSYLLDKLAMDGTTSVLDLISGAFTKTGGVGNAWTDPSNFRTILGSRAPVIAQTNNNLLTNAAATFTPYTGWTAYGAHQVSAQGPADDDGSGSVDITSAGGDANCGVYKATSVVLTVGQPYTCSFRVKAVNAGAVGNTVQVTFDGGAGTAVTLTTNWQTVSKSIASASATNVLMYCLTSTGNANGDEFLISSAQVESGLVATPFALDYRTGGYCRIADPLTAGGDASFVFIVNGPWPGNDGIEHTLFSATGAGAGDVYRLYKGTDNKLYFAVGDKAAVTAALTTTTWAANVNHLIIGTVTGGTINVYLAGTAGTQATGATREAALNANLYVGTKTDGTLPVNAAILGAGLGRVLTSGEITALSSLAAWANLYNSLSLTMPLATATGGASAPTILPSAAVPLPVAQATGAAPILIVNPLATVNMPLATATADIYLPTPSANTIANMPVAMMSANAPIPDVAVPTSFLGSPKQISGIAKDRFEIDGRV